MYEGSPQGGIDNVVFESGPPSNSETGSGTGTAPRAGGGSEPVSVSYSVSIAEARLRGARRASIAPSTRNFVRRHAADACEFLGPGDQRCGSRFQTQMDHVIPVALGGTNDVTNLRLLCRTLDLLMAEKTLGLKKMSQFRKPF
jgi:5-methylcytosine-specific restriction endonuclease McrA